MLFLLKRIKLIKVIGRPENTILLSFPGLGTLANRVLMSAPSRLSLIAAEHRYLGRGIARKALLLYFSREWTIAFLND